MLLLTFAVLFVALLTTDGVAKTSTPTPVPATNETSTLPSNGSTGSANNIIISTAAPVPLPVPIHKAQANSDTFRVTDNVVCPDLVAVQINAAYAKNRKVFADCMDSSGYQIFPYSGTVPTAEDISRMVQSPACMAVITATVINNMPACSLGDMPVKAVVETLLKISEDMADGAPAPSAVEFHALMSWRRDVNAAKQAGVPYDGDSELYAIFTKELAHALATTSVKVLPDFTITYPGAPQTFEKTSGSALSSVAGVVKPSDASGSGTLGKPISTPAASEVQTRSSSASSMAARSSSLLVAGCAVLAAVVGWTA